jgi:hypothetical protein
MKRPDFPLVWDNSMRSAFVECPQKFAWEYMHHFKSKAPSVHLHAGGVWASALETTRMAFYRDETPAPDAVAQGLAHLVQAYGTFDPGRHDNKSCERLMEAFRYYWKAFPLETDPVQPYMGKNGPMVEFSFALPLDASLIHPVTGEPIIYTGRADMVATYAGAVSIYDDKTTSSLGASWAGQWDRRSQFTGYVWAANAYGIPVTQVVVRGIALLKTSTNHAQALTVRTAHHIQEWHTQAVRDIRRAMECWKEGYWDLNLADACSGYGGCLFKQPCMSSNPDPWLTGGNYAIRVWDPVNRTETDIPLIAQDNG